MVGQGMATVDPLTGVSHPLPVPGPVHLGTGVLAPREGEEVLFWDDDSLKRVMPISMFGSRPCSYPLLPLSFGECGHFPGSIVLPLPYGLFSGFQNMLPELSYRRFGFEDSLKAVGYQVTVRHRCISPLTDRTSVERVRRTQDRSMHYPASLLASKISTSENLDQYTLN